MLKIKSALFNGDVAMIYMFPVSSLMLSGFLLQCLSSVL